MQEELTYSILVEQKTLYSENLGRDVVVDFYLPTQVRHPEQMNLLLINDGQDLPKMPFEDLLRDLYYYRDIEPLFCVGLLKAKNIHLPVLIVPSTTSHIISGIPEASSNIINTSFA
jgi:enterochelin esterase-like enzyme